MLFLFYTFILTYVKDKALEVHQFRYKFTYKLKKNVLFFNSTTCSVFPLEQEVLLVLSSDRGPCVCRVVAS